jgi:hypothetical protein
MASIKVWQGKHRGSALGTLFIEVELLEDYLP